MSDKFPGEILLQKYYDKLVRTIGRTINDILRGLVSGTDGVIDIDEKNKIKQFGETQCDKAEYLLDEHIKRSLCVGITDSFSKLLQVMKAIPAADCNQLARTIEQDFIKLDGENASRSDDITKCKGKIFVAILN